jgi:hypothetical protein
MILLAGSVEGQLLSGTFPLETGQVTFPVMNSSATGSATCTLDQATRVFTWSVSHSNLSSPITMAHFHLGRPGLNGPIQIDVTSSLAAGSATLSGLQAGAVANDRWHLLIHTSGNPAGELRGQVKLSPVSVVPVIGPWTAALMGFAFLVTGAAAVRLVRPCSARD